MTKNSDHIKKELQERVHHCREVVNGLENYEPYRKMIGDYKKRLEEADSTWHLCSDSFQLSERRIAKMASLSVIGALEAYKADLKTLEKQLYEIEHPNEVQTRYYDET